MILQDVQEEADANMRPCVAKCHATMAPSFTYECSALWLRRLPGRLRTDRHI
jgi:hypothetical protein